MLRELKAGFVELKGFRYFLLLASLAIGYLSPIVAVLIFLFTFKNEANRIYGYVSIIGGIIALVLYVLTYIISLF